MRLFIPIFAFLAGASIPLIAQAIAAISETRTFGKTEGDIHYFDYLLRSAKADRDTNNELLEARYVKH